MLVYRITIPDDLNPLGEADDNQNTSLWLQDTYNSCLKPRTVCLLFSIF